MPTVLWLGMHEYMGVWWHGGKHSRFADHKVFRFLGDGRMAVLSKATQQQYGHKFNGSRVLSDTSYQSNFMHWAITFLHFWSQYRGMLVLERSWPGQDTAWCGVDGCLYPYMTITQVVVVAAAMYHQLDQDVGWESREPFEGLSRSIRLHWGVFIAVWNLNQDGDRVVTGENQANKNGHN